MFRMFVMKKIIISKSLLLIIIINLAVMFVAVVLAKSDHDHHHHHYHDHSHSHKLNKAKKIYNGKRASPEKAKFMAAILWPRGDGSTAHRRILCSAVIITHDMLLTAAHCFDNKSLSDILRWEVLPGASHINFNYYQTHLYLIKTIQDFWIHPKYDEKRNTYDLAIIRVGPGPWIFGEELTVAQMPVRVKRRRLPFKSYGYGREYGNVRTGNLNVIEYTREYPQEYLQLMFRIRINGRNILFATKEVSHHHHLHISSGQSKGDSGGGVFLDGTVKRFDTSAKKWIQIDREILVGLVSEGFQRNETMRPRRYFFHTNITTLLPWINRFIDARLDTYPLPQPLL